MWMKYFFVFTLPCSMLGVVIVGQSMESHKYITFLLTLPVLGGTFYGGNLLWEVYLMLVNKVQTCEIFVRIILHGCIWFGIITTVYYLTIVGGMRGAYISEDTLYGKLKPPQAPNRNLLFPTKM
jgi:hypothetical protein